MCVKFSKLVLGAAAVRSPSMSAALAARTCMRAQSNPSAAIFSIPPFSASDFSRIYGQFTKPFETKFRDPWIATAAAQLLASRSISRIGSPDGCVREKLRDHAKEIENV
jgi:hypothetical protein